MKTNCPAELSAVEHTPPARVHPPEAGRRVIARFSLATLSSAVLCLLMWSEVPRSLSGRIDIVGFPTFANFDYKPMFWAYRLVVYALPLLSIVFYAVLGRYGPLRLRTPPTARGTVSMVEPHLTGSATPGFVQLIFGVVPRLALPLGVVVAAAAARTGQIRGFAVACGLVYFLAVLTGGIFWSWIWSRTGSRTRAEAFWDGIAWANGTAGSTGALIGLWFVSRHTIVLVAGIGRPWPWMPLWLAIAGVGGVLGWALRQFRRGKSARGIEKILLIVIVGSVALFLAISALPHQTMEFQGFDDAQPMAGAALLSRGYFPWRDLLFIHGLFPDVLRGTLGMALFGDSIWGVLAGGTVVLIPLSSVVLYLYAAWISRGNPWFSAIVWVGAALGFYPALDTRFILVPLTLVLLGEIRRHSEIWCVGLVLMLFAQAVLVPETSFLAVPALVCVFAADIVHREKGLGPWKTMRRSRWCLATGIIALLFFGTVLSWHGALGSFVDYYRVFGPGHNESGALPYTEVTTWDYVRWTAGIVVVVVTVWSTVWLIRRRGDWEPTDWVAVAAAGFVAPYEEKALGRFDSYHISQVFAVALPLILLWLWKALRAADAIVERRPAVRWMSAISFAPTATAIALVVVVFMTSDSLVSTARNVGQRHQMTASLDSTYPRVGYAAPGVLPAGLLRDLDVALRTYAGDNTPVFDMTNSPGYFYYLLGREPGTRFQHVSMAIPPYAQQLLIKELKRSQPPVVIFDSTWLGLWRWDMISNNIRHYQVSQYILDGWIPVIRTHGVLLAVRRDLVAQGLPTPPLMEPPVTTDLWFSEPNCTWGASPNFLRSVPQGASVQLPVQPLGRHPIVDITGWAADPITGRPARTVVLASRQKVVASLTPSLERQDVARTLGTVSSASGFHFSGVVPDDKNISLYMLSEDNKLHPLAGSTPSGVASIELPDGQVLPTAESPAGHIDGYNAVLRTIGQIELPHGTNLAEYKLASLSTGGSPPAKGDIEITDSLGQDSHYISAYSLPELGHDLAIRVGSCLQWHGYDSAKPLYVMQADGAPVTVMTLSGVRA